MKDLKLSLIVQAFDRATAPLRKVSQGLKGIEERAERLKNAFGHLKLVGILGGGLAIGGAIEAGRGIFELTKKTAEFGEEMLHTAQKTGMTVESIQRLRFAARQAGVDVDTLGNTFFMLEAHMGHGLQGTKPVLKALGKLGLTLSDLKRLSKDPLQAFYALQDHFSKIKNASILSSTAMDLFGRGGKAIIPLLKMGSKETRAWGEELQALGGILSEEDAEKSESFIQRLNLFDQAMAAISLKFGLAFMPAISRVLDRLLSFVKAMKPAAIDRFTDSIIRLIDMLPSLVGLLQNALDFTSRYLPLFVRWTERVGGLKTILAAIVGLGLIEFIANLVTVFGALASVIGVLNVVGLIASMGRLVSIFRLATAVAWGFDIALWANPIGLIVAAVGLLAVAVGVVVLKFKTFENIAQSGARLMAHVFLLLWKNLPNGLDAAVNAIERSFDGLWNRITLGMPDWLKSAIKIGAIGGMFALNPVGAVAMATPLASKAIGAAAHGHVRVDVHLHQNGQMKSVSAHSTAGPVSTTIHRGPVHG